MVNGFGTFKKRRRYMALLTLLFMMVAMFGAMPQSFAANENDKLQTEAVSAILFDAKRGQVIYSKTSDEPSNSSLANRVMAALIVLEKADTEALVTASKDAANVEGASLKLSVGEKYAVKNLLNALLLTGSKDAAIALAEYVGGSEDGFVKLMNSKAHELGMNKTRFVNCTGDFDERQVTTIQDIQILFRYALAKSDFNKFFGAQAKPWYDSTKTLLLTNTNNMFWNYNDTDGGITTSVDKELQSIATTVTRNNMRLVCILLDVPTKNMYADSIALLNYGFENYLYSTLVYAGSSQKTVTVEGQTLNLVPAQDVQYIHPKGQSNIKNIALNVDESKLKPPITKNTVIGMLTYTLGDDTVINVELYPDREILPQKTQKQLLQEKLNENKELIYVIILLVVIEIIMALIKLGGFIKKQLIKAQVRRLRRR
jgi:D-alanyl-D-alanine carboxypeptidase/D-alanyl-D-alanine carboxypeptidase (penicillin-binding protein 5/6)